MSDSYGFHQGTAPLLISVPHDGWQIPGDIVQQMTGIARGIPDTDWHVSKLYAFARDLGASMIVANFSRYVVDLNRPPEDTAMYDGQLATGLVPRQTFAGDDIYLESNSIDEAERMDRFWRPYHDRISSALAGIRDRHDHALLWDAHSIASRVPRLFDGELPELNFGTWDERSCDPHLAGAVIAAAKGSDYGAVLNERFTGGYITRHYGCPGDNVQAIQLEIAQRTYMNERTLEYDENRASQLRDTLAHLLRTFIEAAGQ